MPETTFHTTFSTSLFSLSRAKNGSESGLRSVVSYRFGFNGKENDNEVKGTGNQQDYGMRIYDPRIARFLSADPLIVQEQKYPWYSPYQFAGNKPICAIDLDGEEELLVTEYYNASNQLYKTEIEVVNVTNGYNTNTFMIAHYSRVDIDAGGNATISYVGTTSGNSTNNGLNGTTLDPMYTAVPALNILTTLLQNNDLTNINTNGIFNANGAVSLITVNNPANAPDPATTVDLCNPVNPGIGGQGINNAVPFSPYDRYDVNTKAPLITPDGKGSGHAGTFGQDTRTNSFGIPAQGGDPRTISGQPTQAAAAAAKKSGTKVGSDKPVGTKQVTYL